MQEAAGPRHVGIIMDGNGRWAKSRGWRRLQGHVQGADKVISIIDAAIALNVETLSLFCFSTENWKRPEEEISFLMDLLYKFVERQLEGLIQRKIRVRVLGDLTKAPHRLQLKLEETVRRSKHNSLLNLNFMMSYGGRLDILNATKKLAEKVKSGELKSEDITNEVFSDNLFTHDLKDPDLIIRTSGEFRISNFMLWQSAYSEFYISPKYWPDFTPEDLKKACEHYANRERRYGCITETETVI